MGVEAFDGSTLAFNGSALSQASDKTSYYDHHLTKLAGLTRYGLIRDADQQSVASSDDASSVVDSVFSDQDAQSVTSSQSSDASSASDSSEEGSDGENTNFTARLNSHKSNKDHREELLSGLSSETLPFRTISNKQSTSTLSSLQRDVTGTQQQEHGQYSRRRSGAECTISPVPRLKRDTDTSDCFVGLLICKSGVDALDQKIFLTHASAFATRLITAIWPLSACPPMMSSSFNGAGVLPLEVFIHETLRRSKTSFSTLQVALWYLVLLKCDMPTERSTGPSSDCRAIQCGRRMFLAALMLASKYLQDRNYSTRAWSKISGLRMCEINENEMNYLKAINYNLHVKKDVFENWTRLVLNLSKLSKTKPLCSTPGWAVNDVPESGHFSTLAAMASDGDQPRLDLFTCQWWNDVLRQINPTICQDSASTDSFLRKVIPHNNVTADSRVDLSSPVGSTGYPSDTFNDATMAKGVYSAASTPETANSPASSVSHLPLRPHLRNLPTPVSTPRQSEGYQPWLFRPAESSAPGLRCSASFDALRNASKHCLANANLDRCPPPRAQTFGCMGNRPAMSSRLNHCSSQPSVPSASDPRSRSSSISSTSSWPDSSGTVANMPQGLPYQSQEPSPLTRVVSMPESRMPSQTTGQHPLRRKPQYSNIGARSCATSTISPSTLSATTSSSAEAFVGTPIKADTDAQIAEALVQMARERQARASHVQLSGSEARGHKRTCSSTIDRNNENQNPSSTSAPANILPHPVTDVEASKGWQMPTKAWAEPKKPMSRLFDHKRMALNCAPNDTIAESPASKQASLYLRDHLVSA